MEVAALLIGLVAVALAVVNRFSITEQTNVNDGLTLRQNALAERVGRLDAFIGQLKTERDEAASAGMGGGN